MNSAIHVQENIRVEPMHTLSDLEVKHADSNGNMVMKRTYELSLKEPDTPSIFDNSSGGLGTEASGAKHSSRIVSGSHLSSTL